MLMPVKTKQRCTNLNCGRLWEGNYNRCQKCGGVLERIDEAGNVITEKITHKSSFF